MEVQPPLHTNYPVTLVGERTTSSAVIRSHLTTDTMLSPNDLDAFKDSLSAGHYNLLLGSGVSLDSTNEAGETLRGIAALTKRLCEIGGVAPSTTLQRVASLLDDQQREVELVQHYSCATSGPTLEKIPNYLWRRIFTFNIDDVLEVVYQNSPQRKQSIEPLVYASPFEPTPLRDRAQLIHLHGAVTFPDTPFVFSLVDYARIIQDANPWIALLASILPTEPFIISGSSLNEVDVQAFLRPRSNPTSQRTRGPSLLIEPYPDKITKQDCARLNLTLVEATLEQFMNWLQEEIPNPPSVADLVAPNRLALLPDSVDQRSRLRFFTDFTFVSPAELPQHPMPSAFLYGREPSWADIQAHMDVERDANTAFLRQVPAATTLDADRIICLTDDEAIGGTGKSTVLKRVGHDLARRGEIVFYRSGEYRANNEVVAACIKTLVKRPILLYDNLGDYAEEVAALCDICSAPFVVLGADRTYRMSHLRNVFGNVTWKMVRAVQPTKREYENMIALFGRYGLLASDEFVKYPSQAVKKLYGDPMAVAACRLLNDFRPLSIIAESMWQDANPSHHVPYLIAALAHHCHHTGLRLSLLNSAAATANLPAMFDDDEPLSLDLHPLLDDFVVPTNQVLADAVLRFATEQSLPELLEAFTRLAEVLAPFVNRAAIVRRSAEALIARRLLDVDRIVKPFLENRAEVFFVSVQEKWRWNSRYWEQLALLFASDDIETAIRHARHAVAIERHPYPLTTLGSLLLRRIEDGGNQGQALFNEAMGLLVDAINLEYDNSRVAVHPYVALINGAAKYREHGGTFNSEQADQLSRIVGDVRHRFRRDTATQQAADRLERVL